MSDTYRQAASMLLLRPVEDDGGAFEILLLHKPRKRDAWQLPQGGMEEGESVEECALRELREEAGIIDATVFGRSDMVYQYDFPESYRRFRPDNICGQHIGFVFAIVPSQVKVRVDRKEVDSYKWVRVGELSRYIKRKAYLELAETLFEEALLMMKM